MSTRNYFSGVAVRDRVTTVIIGAGQAGLAMSRCLSERSIDHVLIERGEVANAWRTQRWDSLRLLTPRWQSRLPGYRYTGDQSDGFMAMPEVVAFMSDYARHIDAPVYTGVEVTRVTRSDEGYRVITNQGEWRAGTVVLASGVHNKPALPSIAAAMPEGLNNVTPLNYRNPSQLSDGGVLVVGASATGLQLAAEIQRSGREVTLAVGEHVRLPRQYRGKDILWWMDRIGMMDECYQSVDDLKRVRRLPSPQLSGSGPSGNLDLSLVRCLGLCTSLGPRSNPKRAFRVFEN